ncbi:MAG: transketolase [Candidatus Riflebacteria bacterium HGW-Riflebacteria-2]|jgi:transketolase|nr:MAG: transketolase [Candidatus Riflebacteria bacterium HGW-Riflebacteria-2]
MSYDTSLIRELKHRAARIRWLSLKTTAEAGSGHPTSCCSCAEILSALFFKVMRYDPKNPGAHSNDRLVMSKGHAAPALYAAWCEAGYLEEKELFTLRKMGSRIEGHPMPSLPFVDVATGSLGQGLSVGLGISLQQQKVVKNGARTFVLLGDGEMAEGSVWEALALADNLKAPNLVAIIDVNRLGQSRETMHGHDIRTYARKAEAFGWEAIVVENGHDIEAVLKGLEQATNVSGKPACVIVKTYKGGGLSQISDKENWHGKPVMPGHGLEEALAEVEKDIMKSPPAPAIARPEAMQDKIVTGPVAEKIEPAPYKKGDKAATRQAVGPALVNLGKADERIWVIDGDTQNSTYAQKFGEAYPERFVECFIAEQNMAGVAAGLASRGLIPFATTFGAFLARAFDQIRMAALSGLKVKFIGTHAGISIGEDGPSQMALEDLASFATLPNGAVFYPSDAVSAYNCIVNLARHEGPGYVRLSRPNSEVLYDASEQFPSGGLKVLKKSDTPALTVVSAGVIVHEALKAIKNLPGSEKIQLVDLYSLKPFPTEELSKLVNASNGNVAVFEEHAVEGGIGATVALKLAGHIKSFKHVAVTSVPRSGTPDELLASFGLSADKIAETLKAILK